MKWFYQIRSPAQVETEITQRDQFSNDRVSLNETIVREAVQNSLDACEESSKHVKVVFRWLDKHDGLQANYFRELFEGQLDHAKAAGLSVDELDFENPTALVIEDFGTSGLTGEIDKKDDNHFSDFWRRHGKSHKSGKSRGRWGLGKLVYSTTSGLGVFFGLTKRAEDTKPHLMGQSVLNLYHYAGNDYLPHSFFADQTHPNEPLKNLPIPVKDLEVVDKFCEQFSLDRRDNNGLSIVIPFPDSTFVPDSMIRVAIENYFYPIVTGHLSLVIDNVELSSANVRELAYRYAPDMHTDVEKLFDFIESVASFGKEKLVVLNESWWKDKKIVEDDFVETDLAKLKQSFVEGELCGLKLPILLRKKKIGGGSYEINTFVTAFLQRPEELDRGLDLYVRGGLTLPDEYKFKSRRAFAVMSADEEEICDFLGNAENPAHTQWNLGTEKLKKQYVSPQDTVRAIKNSLVHLFELIAEIEDEKDDTALSSFFTMEELSGKSGKKTKSKAGKDKGKLEKPKPTNSPIRKKIFDVRKVLDGFVIETKVDNIVGSLPATYRVRMAYDDGSSNPIRNYNPFDFNVGKNGKIKKQMIREGVGKISRKNRIDSARLNEMIIRLEKLPFKLEVTGFDVVRDLVVDIRKIQSDDDENSKIEVGD